MCVFSIPLFSAFKTMPEYIGVKLLNVQSEQALCVPTVSYSGLGDFTEVSVALGDPIALFTPAAAESIRPSGSLPKEKPRWPGTGLQLRLRSTLRGEPTDRACTANNKYTPKTTILDHNLTESLQQSHLRKLITFD